MDESFFAKPLGRRQIDQAYPLICAIAPALTVDRWRAFAAAMIGEGSAAAGPGGGARRNAGMPTGSMPTGIMTVQNANGYLHGLFSYTVEQDLRHGRALVVDNFVVLDLFDLPGAAEVLLHAMDGLARDLGCTAIHTNLPEPYAALSTQEAPSGTGSRVLDCFRGEGHRTETMRLCKAFGGANDNGAGRNGKTIRLAGNGGRDGE